jgi:uncharacterized protein
VAIALIVLAIGVLIYIIQWNGHPHTPVVDLTAGNGTVLHMNVEIADTPAKQNYGLMNRSYLDNNAGMLFVWTSDVQEDFWMYDTLIPLDMIFIAANLTIVDIHENAVPLSKDHIKSCSPYRYVLEVNGGLCAAEGIDIGDRIALDLTRGK